MVFHRRCHILLCARISPQRKPTRESLVQKLTRHVWPGCAFADPLIYRYGFRCGHTHCISARVIRLDLLRGFCPADMDARSAKGNRCISVAPLGCVVLASILLLPPLMGKLSGQHVNLPAPEFSLTTEDGKVLTSAGLRGKVVVLAFWATWCEPCWQELPRVEKVYASYKDSRAVIFWAVNARAGGDTDEMAEAFAKKMRLGLPLAYTENANAVRLGVDGYPTLVLVDASGRVRFIHHGYDGSERLESNLAHEIAGLLPQGG